MADRTAVKIGKRRPFVAMFTDQPDGTGNPAKIDGSASCVVTDDTRGALEGVEDLLNPNGNGEIVGAKGFVRVIGGGDVDLQVTGHDADTNLDTTLTAQLSGMAGDVAGGTIALGGADED